MASTWSIKDTLRSPARTPENPPKLGKTRAPGNRYNPLTLWLFLPQSGKALPPPGDPPERGRRRKTLQVLRNLVRTAGLKRVWVP